MSAATSLTKANEGGERRQSTRAIYMDAPPEPPPVLENEQPTFAEEKSTVKMPNVPYEFLLSSICSAVAKCMSIPAAPTLDGSGDNNVHYSLYEHLLRLIEEAEQLPGGGRRIELVRLLRDMEHVSLDLRANTMPLCSPTTTSPVAAYDNQIDPDLLHDKKSADVLGVMRPAFTLEQALMNEEGLDEVIHANNGENGEAGDDAEFDEDINAKTIRKYFCPQAMQLTSLANAAELSLNKEELLLISASINRLANLKLRKLELRSIRFWGKISLVPLLSEAVLRPTSAQQRQAFSNNSAYYIAEAEFPGTSPVWTTCDQLSAQYEQAYATSAKHFKDIYERQRKQYETFRMRAQNQMELAAGYVNREVPPEQPPQMLKQAVKENSKDVSQWPELPPLPRIRDIIYQEYNLIAKGKNPATLTPEELEEKQINLIPRDQAGITGTNRYVYYCTTNLAGDWVMLPHTSPHAIRHARMRLNQRFTGNLERSIVSNGKYYGKECEYLRSQIARITHGCALAPQNYVQTDDEVENEDGLIDFVDNPDFESSPMRDVLEQKQEFFVHARPYLYKQGRCSFIDLPNPDDDEEAAVDLDDEEMEAVLNMLGLEEPPPPPSVLRKPSDTTILDAEPADLPQPIGIITEDVPATSGTSFSLAAAEFAQQRPWATRTTNFLLPEMASVLARSCMWPGACFVYQQNQLENFYVGYGTKRVGITGENLMPNETSLLTQKEYAGPELQEQEDTSVQVEKEYEDMLEKRRKAAEENEEDGGVTEGDEEGDEEEGDQDDEDQY